MKDTDALAARTFRQEGAFLLAADRAATILQTRIGRQRTMAVAFSLDEARELARVLRVVTDIAREYHLGAAECGR